MSRIINATSVLLNERNRPYIEALAADLRLISAKIHFIDQIVVRGGCILDIIYNLKPNDIDLFYSAKENRKWITQCRCDEIRSLIRPLSFKYIAKRAIDLENSYEKEPALDPVTRTVGLFSFHADYVSMLALDQDGQIWTNMDALRYIQSKVYEINYAGFLPWAYFPHRNDNHHYYSFFCYQLIRGIGYIRKRDLAPGARFMEIVRYAPILVERGIKEVDPRKFQKYASKKGLTLKVVKKFLETQHLGKESQKIYRAFAKLLGN